MPSAALYERARGEGFEVHEVQCSGQVDRAAVRGLRELVSRTGAGVVHAHGYKADVYAWAAMRGSGTPLVSTCHTWYDNDLLMRGYGMLDRLVLRGFARVAAVSEEVRDKLLGSGIAEARVRLVRNGIDMTPFADAGRKDALETGWGGVKERELRVGLVGRLAREKGVDLFLRAAARVVGEVAGVRFVVAGDGPDWGALEGLIGELGLRERAWLVGRQEDMSGFFGSLDLLVSASRQEGLPMALLEGMASGLAVVATDVGAVGSVVRDGRTGILVAGGDVEALAGAMVKLLRDGELRLRYGKAGRERVAEEFSARRMTAEYAEIYEQAWAERVGSRR
jgi:glycosyltransferase involved in cell wall biosynthesis